MQLNCLPQTVIADCSTLNLEPTVRLELTTC